MTMEEGSQKSERNESFTGKGTANKKTVRSVLDSPFTPRVVVHDSGDVANCLLSLRISKEEKQMHWDTLKKMSKEERRRFRQVENAEFLELRHGMLIGWNEILRGLQRERIASLIISDKFSWNSLLGKILIESAERNRIPVIKLSSFHELLKKSFGIQCHAMGVKKLAAENKNSKLHSLHEAIVKADTGLRVFKPHTQKEMKERRKPHPYHRNFYSKKKSSWDKSFVDDKMDFEDQYPGNSAAGVKRSLECLTVDRSKLTTQNLSEGQKSEIQFQHYKPLRVKEVISVKNPPKSKKGK